MRKLLILTIIFMAVIIASLIFIINNTPQSTERYYEDSNLDYNEAISRFAVFGGNNYTDGNYTVHVFRDVGTWSFNYTGTNPLNVSVLVVAGGGGGGAGLGSGGGAGGLIYNLSYYINAGNYSVIVGAGGAGGAAGGANHGTKGQNSSFSNLIAVGGGQGYGIGADGNGFPGGSGGGASWNGIGGAGVAGQGNKGGNGTTNGAGGGGGGAGSAGFNGTTPGTGAGGAGLNISINGTWVFYAGGGGAGRCSACPGGGAGTGGLGGNGSGGSGGGASQAGFNGVNGTGGGGGGGDYQPTRYAGGRGGDGIVIIRYLTADAQEANGVINSSSVSLISPANNTFTIGNITHSASLTSTGTWFMKNATLYVWNSSNSLIRTELNTTINGLNGTITINFTSYNYTTYDTYKWNVLLNTNSSSSWASSNYTLTISPFPDNYNNITGCVAITSPGIYRFKNDIYTANSSSGKRGCITIQADNVSIDGNGYTLYVNSAVDMAILSDPADNGGNSADVYSYNITVKNINIKQTVSNGVAVSAISDSISGNMNNTRWYNLTVNNSIEGFSISGYNSIGDNIVMDNITGANGPTWYFTCMFNFSMDNVKVINPRNASAHWYSVQTASHCSGDPTTPPSLYWRNLTYIFGNTTLIFRDFTFPSNQRHDLPWSALNVGNSNVTLNANISTGYGYTATMLETNLTIKFSNLNLANVTNISIYKNGLLCPSNVCNVTNWTTNDLTFNAIGAGAYTYNILTNNGTVAQSLGVNITYPTNITYNSVNQPTQINFNVYNNTALSSCWYSTNGGATNITTSCFANITGLTASSGSNTWLVAVNNSANTNNMSKITFNVDNSAPTVSIVYPVNGANYSALTWLGQLNYTASDNTALDKCWYSVNGVETFVTCGTNVTGLEPYQYPTLNNITFYVNDTAGNIGSTNIVFYALTNSPKFTQLFNKNWTTNSITLNTTITQNMSGYTVNCEGVFPCLAVTFTYLNNATPTPFNLTYRINNINQFSTINRIIKTLTFTSTNSNISAAPANYYNFVDNYYSNTNTSLNINLPDGSYIWNATITDAFGNSNTTENRQFIIDTTSPVVSIQYPAGIISDLEAGNNVTLNFSATDTNLDKCWFNYNGVNTTIPCNNNASFLYVLGSNNVTVYANDTVGFTTSAFSSWSPGIVIGNVSWPLTVYETEQGTFNISYTLDNIYSTTARLIYNGTSYLATTNCIGNICSATSTITIPTIVLTAPQNTSFFWAIQATNGTAIINKNTTTYTNLILDSTLNYCTAGNISLNVTFRDELTLGIINAGINVNLDYNLGGTTNQNFGYLNNTQNRSTYSFCINPGTAYFNVTGVINYFKDGYGTRNYVFDNAQLSNITQNLTLYLMNSSFATNVQFRVIDDSNNPVAGAILTIQRWDLTTNSYSAVDIITTDSGGFGVSDLQLNSAWYRYLVSYNGILYLTTTAAVETQTTKILQINFESENPFNQFNTMFGNVTYNNGTRTFTYIFQDTSGALNEGCLKVVKNTPGTTQIISEQCLTASSGTLLYTIPANINGTYIGYGIAKLTSQFNSAESVLDLAYAYLGDLASDIVGDFGFIILVIALITVGAIAASSGSMIIGVIGIFAIIFFGSLLGWINIAGSGVLISIGIILLLIGYSAYRRPQ